MSKLPCRTTTILAPLAIAAIVTACGSTSDNPTGLARPGAEVQIELIGGAFAPAELTIDRGTTVRWVNRAGAHTVTPDGHDRWRSQPVAAVDQRFEHTFTLSGTFAYYCEPHASHGMKGIINV